MLERFQPVPPDPILGLGQLYAADPRDDKIDLGVGVFKDAAGNTPIMTAVRKAEVVLHDQQTTKAYKGLAGDEAFRDEMRQLVLGDAVPTDRVATIQTPGGTGAIRQLYETLKMINIDATLWVSDPTWPSHVGMAKHMGLKLAKYRYFDAATSNVDTAAMMEDIQAMQPGDVLLLHGCCHNPTGANLGSDDWQALTDFVLEKNVTPFVDIAYQGFGDGLAKDAANLRMMAARVPEMLIAASCSKNFGLYRDRVGCAMAVCSSAEQHAVVSRNLAVLNRLNYSFAPDHGAACVAIILGDTALRAEWESELNDMRATMMTIRQDLADALRRQCNSDRFDFIAEHRGMFSRLGLATPEVEALRTDHGMYVVGDSRINIAGLSGGRHEPFANAVAAVLAG
ncbi:MAG TPA: aromatic amino acid aminotransferase [Alphaproteobacteria bacterium]|nr:aromatic amino acid aminotransferase [Alphaproteobacteria bacterium]